ncbi:MAG: PEP-CTERM sorting domain-containing protein [Pirellulales bacterium]
MKKASLASTLCFFVLCGLAVPKAACAAALTSGATLVAPLGEVDPVGGNPIGSLIQPFSSPGSVSGRLISQVISGDPSNALGGLTFVYFLVNDGAAGPHSIGRLSVDDFAGWQVDASYQTTSVGIAPGSIDRQPSGDVVGFNFLPTGFDPLTGFLAPGATSRKLVLQTNALRYTNVMASIINGGVTQAASFGPAPVPEPSTLLLAALAGLGLLAVRFKAHRHVGR